MGKLYMVKPFNDGIDDFDSGKKLAPPRELWTRCEVCGKLMYKGFVLSNGAKIGKECESSLYVFNAYSVKDQKGADFFSITPKQFSYFTQYGR